MLLRTLASFCLLTAISQGALREVHVGERSDVEQGKSFGKAGPYERITGTAMFCDDPALPANRLIHDLALAPKNKKGCVESSADFYVLKPRNPALGNGDLLFEVANRGGKGMVGFFDFAPGSAKPGTEPGDLGDTYLLEQGYTLVWLGWQFDAPSGPDILHLFTPIARNPDGSRIRGLVRSDFVLDQSAKSASLADMGHRPYLAADLKDPNARLTVRDRVEDIRQDIPRAQWRFAREENGRPVPDAGSIYLPSGFLAGRIYEVVYTSQDPPVAGLGFGAVRDFISFLKYGGAETLLGDQAKYLKRSIAFGVSQSGRFLRDFLYQGFNADEKNRRVFDGVWAHVAGAGRGNFNYRFAQASRDARPFLNFFYPVDIFPFTDVPETDETNGQTGSILESAERNHVTPRVFLTNGSYEYWGRAAALIHVSPDGRSDVAPSPGTRIYFIAGAQHGYGRLPPPASQTTFQPNPNDYRYILRALLRDLHDWVKDGVEPPPSRYPDIADGQLTPLPLPGFPHLPGVVAPERAHKAYRVDYGPEFVSSGIIQEPPKVGQPFPLLVPRVDADGIDLGGIRSPEVDAPLGTYTGWNYRSRQIGAGDEMASFIGSFFPFPRNKSARLAQHDPRLSIEERYPALNVYLERIRQSASELAKHRFFLDQDVPRVLERAKQEWGIWAR